MSAHVTFYNVNNGAIFMNGTQITAPDGKIFADYTGYVKNVVYDAVAKTLTLDILHFHRLRCEIFNRKNL